MNKISVCFILHSLSQIYSPARIDRVCHSSLPSAYTLYTEYISHFSSTGTDARDQHWASPQWSDPLQGTKSSPAIVCWGTSQLPHRRSYQHWQPLPNVHWMGCIHVGGKALLLCLNGCWNMYNNMHYIHTFHYIFIKDHFYLIDIFLVLLRWNIIAEIVIKHHCTGAVWGRNNVNDI